MDKTLGFIFSIIGWLILFGWFGGWGYAIISSFNNEEYATATLLTIIVVWSSFSIFGIINQSGKKLN